MYFCYTEANDVYGALANPSFQIYYSFCSPIGPVNWVLTFGGVQRRCITFSSSSAAKLIIALETAPFGTTEDFNIDVKYTNVYKNLSSSSTWVQFGGCPQPPGFADSNYALVSVSGFACNTYFPPLD